MSVHSLRTKRLGNLTNTQRVDAAIRKLETDILNLLLDNTESGLVRAMIYRELGNRWMTTGSYEIAKTMYYNGLLGLGEGDGLDHFLEIARLKALLSTVLLKLGHKDQAIKEALDAYAALNVFTTSPHEKAWIIHAIIQAYRAHWLRRECLRNWVIREGREIKYMWPREKNSCKYIWLAGYLQDVAYAWGSYTWGCYVLAYLIMLFGGKAKFC